MGEDFRQRESAGRDKGKRDAGAAVLLPQVDSLKHLLEAGASVNAPPDPCEQSPVHLAAGGGLAGLLLWQLQTGADLNQQVTRLPIVAVDRPPPPPRSTETFRRRQNIVSLVTNVTIARCLIAI